MPIKPETIFPDWPTYDSATKWANVRMLQKTKLEQSDWTQLVDVSLSSASRQAWQQYRQQLRDLTSLYTDPDDVILPDPPITSTSADATMAEQLEAVTLMVDLLLDTQESA